MHDTYDVFISYSHEDKDWVKGWLLPSIERAGLTACIDDRDFDVGANALTNMAEAVKRSRKTIAVLTPAYVASEWCEFEAVLARTLDPAARKRRVIPILRAKCDIPLILSPLTYLPMKDSAEAQANLPRLIENLREEGPPADEEAAPTSWPPPIFVPPPADTVPPWFVPRPVERDKVLRALGLLGEAAGEGAVALTATVQGMGGVGKTVLAASLLREERVRRRWPEGLLWATLGPDKTEEADANDWLLLWGDAAGADLRTYSTTQQRASVLGGLLAGRQVLLVVDDVWAAAPARALLGCAGEACGRLLTTRHRHVCRSLGLEPTAIDMLTEDEALALLAKRAGEPAMSRISSADVQELCERLGYLPLAVGLAGAQLQAGAAASEFLAPLRAQQGALHLLDHGDADTRLESARLCFDLSADRLPHDDDRQRYAQLGALAPEVAFGSLDAAVVWGLNVDDPGASRHLRTLADAGLIESLSPEETRYRQHALLRQHAWSRLPPDVRAELVARHAQGYAALIRSASTENAWAAVDVLYPQAMAALERAQGELTRGTDTDAARHAQRRLLLVADSLGHYWELRALWPAARLWLARALDCARALGHREAEAVFSGNLGLVAMQQGDYAAALDYLQRSLDLCQELGNPLGQAAALGNLGLMARHEGDYAAAGDYHQRALEIDERFGNPLGQAQNLNNLGVVAAHQGDYAAARDHLERALELCIQLGNPQGQAQALGNLGNVAFQQGDYAAARDYHERTLELDIKLGNLQAQAATLGNLGLEARHGGDTAAARDYIQRSLDLFTQLGNPLGQANALGNLGLVAMDQGDYAAAIDYMQRSAATYRRIGLPIPESVSAALEALENPEPGD